MAKGINNSAIRTKGKTKDELPEKREATGAQLTIRKGSPEAIELFGVANGRELFRILGPQN
jgi:hypothetical protein